MTNKQIKRHEVSTILTKTLAEMPEKFTSHEFMIQARLNGLPESIYQISKWLQSSGRAVQAGAKQTKSWLKTNIGNQDIKIVISPNEQQKCSNPTIDENFCIDSLKKLGYKILKPINQWEEV